MKRESHLLFRPIISSDTDWFTRIYSNPNIRFFYERKILKKVLYGQLPAMEIESPTFLQEILQEVRQKIAWEGLFFHQRLMDRIRRNTTPVNIQKEKIIYEQEFALKKPLKWIFILLII